MSDVSEENGLPVSDEHFLLWVLTAQTKDAILRARERDYARFGTNENGVLFDRIPRRSQYPGRDCPVSS